MRFAKTRRTKDLLFAGTELGIYVSFDDGEQLAAAAAEPARVTSVRDLTIHDDDLVIATYGRSFWILDDITSLRQISRQNTTRRRVVSSQRLPCASTTTSFSARRCRPRNRPRRIRPTARSSTTTCPQPAKSVKLEIFDRSGKLVRRIVSGPTKEQPHPPMAIAERWLPKPDRAGEHGRRASLRLGLALEQLRDQS